MRLTHLSLALFGQFRATLDDHSSASFESDKVRGLLAYLAVESDRAHSRSALAGLLWPDYLEENARTNLRHTLHQLRHSIGDDTADPPFLLITRQTIQFNTTTNVVIDAAQFAMLLSACARHVHQALERCPSCLERLRQVVELYRGEFLHGLTIQDSLPFEEWRRIKQEQFHIQTLAALGHLASAAEAVNDFSQAHRYASRQLELEPWRETAHRQIMRVLARQGARSAAIAQYRACRQVLQSEFGAEPETETTALYENIRTDSFERDQAHAHLQSAVDAQEAKTGSINRSGALAATSVPEVGHIYGRKHEIVQLTAWLVDERCRFVAVVGMGGMGKTTLAAAAARYVAGRFDVVIWRSLLNAPPLSEVLREIVLTLSNQTLSALPVNLSEQLTLLLEYLRRQRCLLVLDNMESVLTSSPARAPAGSYEAYSQLLQGLIEQQHESCVVITSRERPKALTHWESSLSWVRILQLGGLDAAAAQSMLANRGLAGKTQETHALAARYSGNPLALKLVAETVHDLFAGNIASFLHDEAPVFDDIRAVLDQQFERLSALERELLIWLAIEREPVTVHTLRDNLVQPVAMRDLLDALRSLQRHSLLEQTESGITLQNVVIEYLTDVLIEAIYQELGRVAPESTDQEVSAALETAQIRRVALLKAQTKEYLRQSQVRLIVQPIVTRLVAKVGAERVVQQLRRVLVALRAVAPLTPGYVGGNILNLLVHLGADLKGWDFSFLCVWQAYLAGLDASEVNFAHAQIKNAAFTDAFAFVTCAAYSPDGALLAAGAGNGSVKLWQTADGQASALLYGHTNIVEAIAYSPTENLVASGSVDATVRLWDIATRSCRRTFTGHTRGIYGVSFSPNGFMLASASEDGTVRVWDVNSGVCRWILRGHTQRVNAVAFSSGNTILASASEDRTVRLWDVQVGRCFAVLEGHQGEVTGVAFHPAGELVMSSSRDCTIRVWNLHSSETEIVLKDHTAPVRGIALNHTGVLLASASNDKTIRLWRLADWRPQQVLLQGDPVASVAFRPDGQTVVGVSQNLRLQVWDVASGYAQRTLLGYSSNIWSLAVSPDGCLLAGAGEDHILYLWDLPEKKLRSKLRGHTQRIYSVVFSPNGALIASGCSSATVRLWEANSGRAVAQFHAERGLTSLAFSPDGALLAGSSHDQTVYVWKVATGECVHRLTGHTTWVESIAFSPDGVRIASGSHDQTIRLWDADRGELLHTLTGHTQGVSGLAFDPAGRVLASCGWDATVRLWDPVSGQPLTILTEHENLVWRIAFHPAGKLLASASADQTVRLWNVETGQVQAVLRGHSDAVFAVAFSPDGATLYSGGADGAVKVWQIADVVAPTCLTTLRIPGPYAGMNITGVTGITEAQQAVLKTLGATVLDEP
jgi:WD40 repeat protein/DNA-binding SARP family transcriptional activator